LYEVDALLLSGLELGEDSKSFTAGCRIAAKIS
jgi:hypothetical protein